MGWKAPASSTPQAGAPAGGYEFDAKIYTAEGEVLDHEILGFNLGLSQAEIQNWWVSPQNFDPGDPISIEFNLFNGGTLPISGTAIIRVQNEADGVVYESLVTVPSLAPSASSPVQVEWDTTGVSPGDYWISVYFEYGLTATEIKSAVASTFHKVYLPLARR